MAISKTLLAPLLVSLVFLHLAESDISVIRTMLGDKSMSPSPSPSPGPRPGPQKMDCDAACDGRCRSSGRPRLCKRACGTCCNRCNCVPSGTYGHYEECPCYANMTTRQGQHKCP